MEIHQRPCAPAAAGSHGERFSSPWVCSGGLPTHCFVVHAKPVGRDFPIQVLITDRRAFQLGTERLGAAVCHVVMHGPVDELAALTGLGHAINGLDRGFRQDDVDPFGHGN